MAALAQEELLSTAMTATEEIASLQDEVRRLAHARNAVILAHNYQVPDVQDVADFVGDSLGLAIEATRTSKPVIVMCGVYFMAETAKILNMGTTVLTPDPTAGCSLADSITLHQLKAWKAEHPGGTVVSYVNTTAAIKAESDYCVTSGNAEAVIRSIPEHSQILFLPDLYLGTWLKERTGRANMLIWPGECHVHAAIRVSEMRDRLDSHPGAEMLIHPECGCTSRFVHARMTERLDPARTFVLSTEGMVKHAQSSSAKTMIVATENGLLHRLAKEVPGKTYIPADEYAVCRYMKQITLTKVRDSLLHMRTPVEVEATVADHARLAIERMVAVHA